MTFDYTDCETLTAATSLDSLQFVDLPSNKYSYRVRSSEEKNSHPSAPQYAFLDNSQNASVTDVSAQKQCIVEFDVPIDLQPAVLFYYKLTNFFQNHRRYVKSLNSDQLKGKFVSVKTLDSSDCRPLSSINNTAIYPCGLIANSLFNGMFLLIYLCIRRNLSFPDTFSAPTLLNPTESNPSQEYVFSFTGIAWPGESKKYVSNPVPGGYASYADIVPPPNWALRFPNGYTNSTPPPDLKNDEQFQNWMRTAGLPTFTKLYGRNDADTMQKGRYRIVIGMSKILQRTTLLVLIVFIQTSPSCLTKGLSHLSFRLCRGLEGKILSSDGRMLQRRPSSSF